MKRRAVIFYCDNTRSGKLTGAMRDNQNYRSFLMSSLGGEWHPAEILSVRNPTAWDVQRVQSEFLFDADYTNVIYSGHGATNMADNRRQYLELADDDVPFNWLDTGAQRQTLILDTCRNYTTIIPRDLQGFDEDHYYGFLGKDSTRRIFDNAVLKSPPGYSIMYSASPNQSSLDISEGGAYSLSLMKGALRFRDCVPNFNIMNIKGAHLRGSEFLKRDFQKRSPFTQTPVMYRKNRLIQYPFAVKAF